MQNTEAWKRHKLCRDRLRASLRHTQRPIVHHQPYSRKKPTCLITIQTNLKKNKEKKGTPQAHWLRLLIEEELMGKKKPQKTKELSVAIAEASSATAEETQQPSPQPHTPRKRGRPRKVVVEKTESEDNKVVQQVDVSEAQAPPDREIIETRSKRAKTKEEEQQVKVEPSTTASVGATNKEEGVEKREPPRSRARRKSKPRKSS